MAAANGDANAFAALLERHYDRIFRLAFRLLGRADQAEDLTQDICLALPAKITDGVRFSYAIAGFGQLLRGGAYLGGWTFDDAIRLANTARGEDPFGYRAEAVTLMRLAQSLGR
ncbi:magnesium chelatase subunit D [Ruegeria sp. THAF57]|nr:magnesium chelatase subunit D [Ruegeria sp. THAF57]